MIFVVSGPGGVGKGTVVGKLVRTAPHLWLSRSWTTRARRPNEPADAYVFVDRPTFEARIAAGGFLEWAEFLGQLYGTPTPEPPADHDVVLEIDVQGARQVRDRYPDAVMILLVAPSREVQAARLHHRGDPAHKAAERLAVAEKEEVEGREIADYVVVNDTVEQAVAELAGIVDRHRRSLSGDD